jgi:hypothetical protein
MRTDAGKIEEALLQLPAKAKTVARASHLLPASMELTAKQRLKVLPDVTVARLQTAVEEGFRQMGHRSLERVLCGLEAMTWKTAISAHLTQTLLLAPLLASLLAVCSNGLLPQNGLTAALEAVRKDTAAGGLDLGKTPYKAHPNWENGVVQYFNLRLRMMMGKIRQIAESDQAFAVTCKKLEKKDVQTLFNLCVVLNPKLVPVSQGAKELQVAASALPTDSPTQQEELVEQEYRLVATGQKRSATEPDFLEEATAKALRAACEASPLKNHTKAQREQAVADAAVLKRPAAAVLKKPAAAPACKKKLEDTDDSWFEENLNEPRALAEAEPKKKDESRKNFQSRAYHKAALLAKHKGAGAQGQKAWARAASASAGDKFDEE